MVHIDLLGQRHSFLLPVGEVSLSLDGVDGVCRLEVLVYMRVSSHVIFFQRKIVFSYLLL